MYVIIGVWGARERKIGAAYKFFIYTLVGSRMMRIGIRYIKKEIGTTDYMVVIKEVSEMDESIQR